VATLRSAPASNAFVVSASNMPLDHCNAETIVAMTLPSWQIGG
jgi:hypothetical protein